jgi:glycosyltransferase involved in cell wall biosynthesis
MIGRRNSRRRGPGGRRAIKVLLVSLGTPVVACSRVRVHQYLPYLASRGVDARVVPFWPRPDPRPPSTLGPARRSAARLRMVERVARLSLLAPHHDVTVIQRVLLPSRLQRLLAGRARRLVFDFDDAIATTHPGMTDEDRWTRQAEPRFAQMLALSRAVFAATPVLVGQARRHAANVFELPSPVDCDRYRPSDRSGAARVVVGWIGNPSTSRYLHPILPVCRRLAARHPELSFEAVGADPDADLDPFRVRPWSLDSELVHLGDFDIGIMPLDDDPWARGKAGYKLLQYMACGIPSVASPVGVNPGLLRGGACGLLAAGEEEWEQALSTLIADAALRRRMGEAGLAFVRSEYSLSVWAPRYHAALVAVAAGA